MRFAECSLGFVDGFVESAGRSVEFVGNFETLALACC